MKIGMIRIRHVGQTAPLRFTTLGHQVALAVLLVLIGLVIVGCAYLPRHPIESAAVLADVVAQQQPSRLKRTTLEPIRSQIQYTIQHQTCQADLYLPADKVQAGILLVPGAAEQGKDDPRLVAFARTLARAHFAVLIPDLVQVKQFQLGTNNVANLAQGLRFLLSRPDLAPQGRVGLAAMSYAVGPAILAALEPDLRDQISFVLGVGGYYDLEKVVAFFTTGCFRDYTEAGSPWRHLSPNAYGKWIFVLANVKRFSNASDREILQQMAERKLNDPAAPIESLAARLGAQGHAYYELLVNPDPARTPELLKNLPEGLLAEFQALNLASHDLSQLKARLILFHGTDDNIIPYTESLALARAVGKDRVSLFLIKGLAHVDVEAMGFPEKLKLWRGVDVLLRERSRSP